MNLMKILALASRLYLVALSVPFLIACSHNSSTLSPEPVDKTNYSLLKGVNTYYLAEPVFSGSSARSGYTDSITINNIAQRTAAEQLSMKQLKPTSRPSPGTKVCQPAFNLKADACMVITVKDYSTVRRDKIEIGQLARIDYTVELVRVSDKRVIWSDVFSFEDKPLTDDISSASKLYQDKGNSFAYVTALSVFERSIVNMFRKLDEERTNQFLAK